MRARGDRHFSPIRLPGRQNEAMQQQHSTSGSTATPADLSAAANPSAAASPSATTSPSAATDLVPHKRKYENSISALRATDARQVLHRKEIMRKGNAQRQREAHREAHQYLGSEDVPPLVGSKLERIAKAEYEVDQYVDTKDFYTWVKSTREREAIEGYKQLFRLMEKQTNNGLDLRYHKKKVAELTNQRNQLNSSVYSAVVRTSKAVCRAFAQSFYRTLPREIRDMVYRCSWDDDALDSDSKKKASTLEPKLRDTPWNWRCSHIHCNCFKAPDDEKRNIFVYPCFVGRNVAQEAAVAYYRDMPAGRFSHRLEQLKNFLTVDHFHFAVKPLSHIRRLDINISNGSLNGWKDYRVARVIRVNGYRNAFDSLHLLSFKNGFRLNVVISSVVLGGELEIILEGFRSVYCNLRAAGAIITITNTPRPGLLVDATNFYNLDVDAWRIYYKRLKDADHWPSDTSDSSDISDSSSESSDDSSSDSSEESDSDEPNSTPL